MPLLVALGAPLGVSDGSGGWCHIDAAWDREKFGCLLVGGVLGGDVVQLLGGVPKNII
jgi:hypothetical protein